MITNQQNSTSDYKKGKLLIKHMLGLRPTFRFRTDIDYLDNKVMIYNSKYNSHTFSVFNIFHIHGKCIKGHKNNNSGAAPTKKITPPTKFNYGKSNYKSNHTRCLAVGTT